MDWRKDLEKYLVDKYRFPDDARPWAFDLWKAARKTTLEEVLEMSVYSSYVDAIDIEDIKKKLEELE